VAAVAFRALGPLEVGIGERTVPLGGPKPRMLLAALLLRPNSSISADALAEVLWPCGAPPSAPANLRTYVHALRRTAELSARIQRRGTGYVLAAEPDEIDLELFESLVTAARGAGEPAAALALFDQACGLWRGPLLEDLPQSHLWAATVTRLTELRLTAHEERLALRITLGQHDAAAVEARGLLGEHPLREELWRLLVVALSAAGRRAEALRACADAERVLREELTTTPGPALRRLRAELRGNPPCGLPLDVPDFTGRTGVVDELVTALRRHRDTPTVVVVSGPPGIGKSAVAVRVAHAVRAEFPDGQLYFDLAGTSARPRSPQAVQAELLRTLGVHDAALPRAPAERAALLRSRLAGKRLCVVLDDAASAAQVQPLLPGAGGCAVLVTSRVMLPDLAGARPVQLDVLDEDEAARLLAELVGADRTRAEPESAADILRFCGYLPLAIRVAGTRLAHRRGWTLRTMAGRLRDERRRLDELRVGDLAVRASVGLSYELLAPDATLALRLLSLLGPVRWPGWVVTALLDRPADHLLDTLVDTHLVELVDADATGAPRYRLHDLIRCYASELAIQDAAAAPVRRVLETYLALATAAAGRLPSQFLGVVAPWPAPESDELVTDPAAWFDAEHHTGVAAVALAEAHGFDDLAWRLATAFAPYFDLRGHQDDWLRTHETALAAARRVGDRHGEAIVLRNLGQVRLYLDSYTAARAAFAQSHELFEEAGDDRGIALALIGLGTVYRVLGDQERALDSCYAALPLFAAVGDPHGEAVARLAAGTAWLALGCLGPAGRWFADAYELSAAIGDRHREAHALQRIAQLHRRRGDLTTATDHVRRALRIFTDLDDDHCVGYANQSLGELCLASGDLTHARHLLSDSLDTHRRTGDRGSQAKVAELLGRLHEDLGQPEPAHEYYRQARHLRQELATR
jgi:DNA-binding SARP family transcriptional activator